jgi:hypothetical protein
MYMTDSGIKDRLLCTITEISKLIDLKKHDRWATTMWAQDPLTYDS